MNGKKYDARSGMTLSAYNALCIDAIRQGHGLPLPDSAEMASENSDQCTWTMLTGEPLTADGDVQLRAVSSSGVFGIVRKPGDCYRPIRVRFAVEIK